MIFKFYESSRVFFIFCNILRFVFGGFVIFFGGWLDSLGRKGLCIFEELGGFILGFSELV